MSCSGAVVGERRHTRDNRYMARAFLKLQLELSCAIFCTTSWLVSRSVAIFRSSLRGHDRHTARLLKERSHTQER
jgi:hypothetical protein